MFLITSCLFSYISVESEKFNASGKRKKMVISTIYYHSASISDEKYSNISLKTLDSAKLLAS